MALGSFSGRQCSQYGYTTHITSSSQRDTKIELTNTKILNRDLMQPQRPLKRRPAPIIHSSTNAQRSSSRAKWRDLNAHSPVKKRPRKFQPLCRPSCPCSKASATSSTSITTAANVSSRPRGTLQLRARKCEVLRRQLYYLVP